MHKSAYFLAFIYMFFRYCIHYYQLFPRRKCKIWSATTFFLTFINLRCFHNIEFQIPPYFRNIIKTITLQLDYSYCRVLFIKMALWGRFCYFSSEYWCWKCVIFMLNTENISTSHFLQLFKWNPSIHYGNRDHNSHFNPYLFITEISEEFWVLIAFNNTTKLKVPSGKTFNEKYSSTKNVVLVNFHLITFWSPYQELVLEKCCTFELMFSILSKTQINVGTH